jgi:hypothetical protein
VAAISQRLEGYGIPERIIDLNRKGGKEWGSGTVRSSSKGKVIPVLN